MVRNIIKVIEYHTENGAFPNTWELEELSQPHMSFQDAHKLIHRYVKSQNIYVPDRISDGRILRITKMKLKKSTMGASPTVVEAVTSETIQQPVMVETTTVTNAVPSQQVITSAIPTLSVNGTSFRGPMLRQPSPVVNMQPRVMTVGGSRMIEKPLSPRVIKNTPTVVGGPVLVSGSRVATYQNTPLLASPVRTGSPSISSPQTFVSQTSR